MSDPVQIDIWPESDLPVIETPPWIEAPVPAGQTFEKSYECSVCRLLFKERDTTQFRGRRYGVPCGCARDIETLI
jgi:diadenosine tetraphosphatase ApaH/serine/threonine PP2A family protein phosphatase